MNIDKDLYLELLQKEYYAMKDHIAALEQIKSESPAIRQGGSVKPIEVNLDNIQSPEGRLAAATIMHKSNRTLDYLNREIP